MKVSLVGFPEPGSSPGRRITDHQPGGRGFGSHAQVFLGCEMAVTPACLHAGDDSVFVGSNPTGWNQVTHVGFLIIYECRLWVMSSWNSQRDVIIGSFPSLQSRLVVVWVVGGFAHSGFAINVTSVWSWPEVDQRYVCVCFLVHLSLSGPTWASNLLSEDIFGQWGHLKGLFEGSDFRFQDSVIGQGKVRECFMSMSVLSAVQDASVCTFSARASSSVPRAVSVFEVSVCKDLTLSLRPPSCFSLSLSWSWRFSICTGKKGEKHSSTVLFLMHISSIWLRIILGWKVYRLSNSAQMIITLWWRTANTMPTN